MNSREVKLVIGQRVYPVKTPQQESMIKDVANQINEELLKIEAKYFIKDKQDSLAILALQLLMKKRSRGFVKDLKTVDNKQEYNQEISRKIGSLIDKIDLHLKVD